MVVRASGYYGETLKGYMELPHHLQCGSQRCPQPLGDGSSRGGSGTGSVQEGVRADGGLFIFGWRHPGLYEGGADPAGI